MVTGLEHSLDPSSYLSALVKIIEGINASHWDGFRKGGSALKCLVFQDPTSAIRDGPSMRSALDTWGFDSGRLHPRQIQSFEVPAHWFESYWPQICVLDRLKRVIERGRENGLPLRIGLSLVE